MKQISVAQLQANQFYWARRLPVDGAPLSEPFELEIVKISTVFGTAPEFWTVAVSGSDEHFDLAAYDFLHKVPSPPIGAASRPNLTVIAATSRALGH